jgi:hypothetical protein
MLFRNHTNLIRKEEGEGEEEEEEEEEWGRFTRFVSCCDDDALLSKTLKTFGSYHLQGAVCREEAPS